MNLNKLALAAAVATFGAISSQAAITITEDYDVSQFSVGFKWNPESPNPESLAGGNANWKWDVKFSYDLSNLYMAINAQHLTPAGGVFSTTLSVPITGKHTDADGDTILEPGPGVGWDTYTTSLTRNSAKLPLTASISAVQEVPEPASVALVAGLGLVGFGAYRRFRKS